MDNSSHSQDSANDPPQHDERNRRAQFPAIGSSEQNTEEPLIINTAIQEIFPIPPYVANYERSYHGFSMFGRGKERTGDFWGSKKLNVAYQHPSAAGQSRSESTSESGTTLRRHLDISESRPTTQSPIVENHSLQRASIPINQELGQPLQATGSQARASQSNADSTMDSADPFSTGRERNSEPVRFRGHSGQQVYVGGATLLNIERFSELVDECCCLKANRGPGSNVATESLRAYIPGAPLTGPVCLTTLSRPTIILLGWRQCAKLAMLAIHSRGEALSVRAMYLAVQSLFNVPEDAQISDLAIEWEQNGMIELSRTMISYPNIFHHPALDSNTLWTFKIPEKINPGEPDILFVRAIDAGNREQHASAAEVLLPRLNPRRPGSDTPGLKRHYDFHHRASFVQGNPNADGDTVPLPSILENLSDPGMRNFHRF